jgi:hypothetical protein
VPPLYRGGDHCPVAAMDAVEIADSNHRPIQPLEAWTFVAHDDERMVGMRFGHDREG